MAGDGVGLERREVVLVDQPLLPSPRPCSAEDTNTIDDVDAFSRPATMCSRFLRAREEVSRAAGDDLLAVPDILLEDALEREQLGRPSTSAIMMTLNDSRSWVNL